MDKYKDNWLPHLKNALPNEEPGGTLSVYAIALEAWRRGITLKLRQLYYKKEKKIRIGFTLSYNGKTHKFNASRGDKVTKEAIKISNDKNLTRKYLNKAQVPTPLGENFHIDMNDKEIMDIVESIGYPVVLKPSEGLKGELVIVNIKDELEFKSSLEHIRRAEKYKDIIVENFVQGEDCRIYVIEDNVIGAVSRIPANILGDGQLSIRKLINQKNNIRNNNPNNYNRPIVIDRELTNLIESEGYNLDSVLNKGTRLFLKKTSNISSGGDAIDLTDELTSEMKKIAIDAAKAIPGLKQCAVDMLIDKNNNNVSVIEVNSKPLIGLHLFPETGKSRDIPKAIIDYYFPETKGLDRNLSFYFDFDGATKLLRNGSIKEITIKKVPDYQEVGKKFNITGEVETAYTKWISRKARSLQLNGFIKKMKDSTVNIVVVGQDERINEFKTILRKHVSGKAKIDNIIEEEWDKPVKMGFYLL
ncbi:acylphosphatase [Oceanobacillus sp. ISL-74]|uniref:acylphosphatase n=1 Tax=Oceanobacillus TaxID=182709 RepID=UPI001BEC269B|nr:acylphosphatase [Oceanobacillus sp. ISL-74]MBT2599383.1 acylphosphatase [Oceanobacillus sp. ISL-74]